MQTDQELVKKLREGNEKAFETLFFRYSEKAYYFAYRYFQNQRDSEELVQELFTKIWMNRERLDPEKSFNAYLFTIAKNSIFNVFRNQRYERAYMQYVRYFVDYAHQRSEEDVVFADLMRYIDAVVEEMPEKRRKIFLMSRKEGMSYKAIAAELQVSEKTVETHIRLALQTIKDALRRQSLLPAFLIPFFVW